MRWAAGGPRSSARDRGLHDVKRTRAQYGPSMLVQPFTNRLGGAGHVEGAKTLERIAQHGPRPRRAAHPNPQIFDHRRRLAALAEHEDRTPRGHIVEQLSAIIWSVSGCPLELPARNDVRLSWMQLRKRRSLVLPVRSSREEDSIRMVLPLIRFARSTINSTEIDWKKMYCSLARDRRTLHNRLHRGRSWPVGV
jgi:hypothetical protein